MGWVRANEAGGPEALAELNRLRLKIDHLNEELRRSRVEAPKGAEQLLQGSEMIPVIVGFDACDDVNLAHSKSTDMPENVRILPTSQ